MKRPTPEGVGVVLRSFIRKIHEDARASAVEQSDRADQYVDVVFERELVGRFSIDDEGPSCLVGLLVMREAVAPDPFILTRTPVVQLLVTEVSEMNQEGSLIEYLEKLDGFPLFLLHDMEMFADMGSAIEQVVGDIGEGVVQAAQDALTLVHGGLSGRLFEGRVTGFGHDSRPF